MSVNGRNLFHERISIQWYRENVKQNDTEMLYSRHM